MREIRYYNKNGCEVSRKNVVSTGAREIFAVDQYGRIYTVVVSDGRFVEIRKIGPKLVPKELDIV